MDEKNHTKENLDSHCLPHGDDELENWTFVNSEDSPLGKLGSAVVNHEDLSDNHSEQGSDSGSSIVVIDTAYASFPRNLSRNGDSSDSDQADTSSDNVKDPEFAGAISERCDEFTKEQSPFLVIKKSSSLCATDEDYSQKTSESKTLSSSQETCVSIIDEEPAENINMALDDLPLANKAQHTANQTVEEKLGKEILAVDGTISELEGETSPTHQKDGDQSIETDEGMQQLLESVSSAGDLDEPVNLDEAEFFNDDENEETDEENWDLGVEAPVYSASLASSSVSSLVEQPDSPSPIIAGQGHAASLVKPDLLEEANRIEELDQYDYSSVTNPDLPPELNVGAILRERAYIHRPNQRLNLQLSYFVAFALAAVFGFALGNLVGLSDNFPSRCTSVKSKPQVPLNNSGWAEEHWRSEVHRLTALNEELKIAAERSAEKLLNLATQNAHFDLRINELISENWDLKQSIGRLRYGRPVRSVEDRHAINTLETENQELRNTVGKLRYKCGQGHTTADQQSFDNHEEATLDFEVQESSGSLLELLGAINRTSEWNKFVESNEENFLLEKLSNLRDTATDLVELISLRRAELGNMTKENNIRPAEKMRASLLKSATKALNVMERLRNHQNAWAAVIDEEQTRLDKVKVKIENRWERFQNPNSCMNESCPVEVKGEAFDTEWSASVEQSIQGFRKTSNQKDWTLEKKMSFQEKNFSKDRESSVDPEWFLVMGKNREKIRRDEAKSEWLFDRAKNRDNERRSRKYQHKGKKPKTSKHEAWNHYSA